MALITMHVYLKMVVCLSFSFAVSFPSCNVTASSTWYLSYSPTARKQYSLLFSKHNLLVFSLCIFLCCGYITASAVIFLQPGIIAWNVPKQIFIRLQTYLCYWDQVLFVCILSDIILPHLPFGIKKYSGKTILLPSAPRKNFFIKHKANGWWLFDIKRVQLTGRKSHGSLSFAVYLCM